MRYWSPRRFVPALAGAIAALTLAACAGRIPEANPADIPRLQQQVQSRPEDTDLQVQLGMAQYKAGDYEQALATLQGAVDGGNETGAALLYLGMTQEQFENWSGARDAYAHYLDVGVSGALKDEIRNRLQLIGQKVLKQQAAEALAQEAQLSSEPATPRSVAVLPFAFNSQRQDLEPLIYALSDMMITDFAVSNTLTVLERSQIQSLLDEMALTEAGYADPATGARSGRILKAEHVVQGVLTTPGQDELRMDQDVLNVPRGTSEGSLSEDDQLQQLFDMEKNLVFRTLSDVLGVELTPAEEQRIRDNRAQNVLAFVAYGRGLRARDRGDYAAAAAAFREAAQLDPTYGAASDAADDAQLLADAAIQSTGDLDRLAINTGEIGGGGALGPPSGLGSVTVGTGAAATASTAGTAGMASESVNPTPTAGTLDLGSTSVGSTETQSGDQRDPVQESQGQETVGQPPTAQIRIVIKRPGGGE